MTVTNYEVGSITDLKVVESTHLVASLSYGEGLAIWDVHNDRAEEHLISSISGNLDVPKADYTSTQFGDIKIVGEGLVGELCQKVVDGVVPSDYDNNERRYARVLFKDASDDRLEEGICILIVDDDAKTAIVVTL